jgi:hypothetical protein
MMTMKLRSYTPRINVSSFGVVPGVKQSGSLAGLTRLMTIKFGAVKSCPTTKGPVILFASHQTTIATAS